MPSQLVNSGMLQPAMARVARCQGRAEGAVAGMILGHRSSVARYLPSVARYLPTVARYLPTVDRYLPTVACYWGTVNCASPAWQQLFRLPPAQKLGRRQAEHHSGRVLRVSKVYANEA